MPHPKLTGNLVGEQVQTFRKRQDMTQAALSAALSVDYKIELAPDLISRIESGERTVRDKELHAIAQALGVSPNDLFDW